MKGALARIKRFLLEEIEQVSSIRKLLHDVLWFLFNVGKKAWEDSCAQRAAALSFFTLLNLFPISGLVLFILARSALVQQNVEAVEAALIEQLVTPAAQKVVEDLFDGISANLSVLGTGVSAFLALALLLLVGSSLILLVDRSLNEIWKAPVTFGGVFSRFSLLWLLIGLLPVLMGFSFALTAWMGRQWAAFHRLERYLIPYCITFLAFFVVYKIVPRIKVRFVPALASAAISALFWEAAKVGLSRYVELVFSKSIVAKLYGSLALVPISMLWVYYSWMILLLGAELTFVVQNHSQLKVETRRRWLLSSGFAPLSRSLAIGLLLDVAGASKGRDAAALVSSYQLHPDQAAGWFESLVDAGMVQRGEDGTLRLLKVPAAITVGEVCALYDARYGAMLAEAPNPVQSWSRTEADGFLRAWGAKSLADLPSAGLQAPAESAQNGSPTAL
jgi:membrane protein